jgi:hypothetical protein
MQKLALEKVYQPHRDHPTQQKGCLDWRMVTLLEGMEVVKTALPPYHRASFLEEHALGLID